MADDWRTERTEYALNLTVDQELGNRLLAIEAVCHAHSGVEVVEHLLVHLVEFLSSGEVERKDACRGLMGYISSYPPRVGAIETLEFVAGSLKWPELKTALSGLRMDSSADFRNRDIAYLALRAFDEDWHGGAYRSFDS